MKEIPVEIRKHNGGYLRGIVHVPEGVSGTQRRRIGINIIVPGIKYRVAPNRLSVKIARALCTEGFYVLRTDPEGVGESDGDFEKGTSLKDIFFHIQRGMFVADTVLSHKFFIREYKLNDTVLLGNCGGAVTALLAHEKLKARNLILIDMPVIYSRNTSYKEQILRGGCYAEESFFRYLRKASDLKSWLRFFLLKSDYGAINAVIRSKCRKIFSKKFSKPNLQNKVIEMESHTEMGEELNLNIFDAFDRFLKKGKALLICGEYDPNTPVFDKYFVNHFFEVSDPHQKHITKVTIKKANHIYRAIQSQEKLLLSITIWLKKNCTQKAVRPQFKKTDLQSLQDTSSTRAVKRQPCDY